MIAYIPGAEIGAHPPLSALNISILVPSHDGVAFNQLANPVFQRPVGFVAGVENSFI